MHRNTLVAMALTVVFIALFWVATLFLPSPANAGMSKFEETVREGVTIFTITKPRTILTLRIYRGVIIEVVQWSRINGGVTSTILTPNHTIQRVNGKEVLRWSKVGVVYEDEWPGE